MRIKRSVNALKKRRKIMKLAKGYFGSKSRSYRIAREAVMKSQMYAFIGRRRKNIDLNRKVLADIAVTDGATFAKLAEKAKAAK